MSYVMNELGRRLQSFLADRATRYGHASVVCTSIRQTVHEGLPFMAVNLVLKGFKQFGFLHSSSP